MAGKRRSSRNKPHANDNLQVLAANLKPVPFLPPRNHDFFTHHDLLERLGLWDFANLDFDALISEIQPDLLAQLIAKFNSAKGCSFVNGDRVSVCRTELARALKLPEKVDGGSEGGDTVTNEMIRFVEDFVFDWIVLRGENDDAVIVPNEISDWVKVIREGRFEKVDWAGMVWFMVEKELMSGRELKDCYYAMHMTCLMKSQLEVSNLHVEEGEKPVELSHPEEWKAKIEDPNSIVDGQNTVIDRQNANIEAHKVLIHSLKCTIDAKDVTIEAQKASINAKDVALEARKALIAKLEKGEHSNKANAEERYGYVRVQKMYEAKIVAQEKEYALMRKLLKGYQEALKRTQMEFREFRDKCKCKNLHEPIYRDVPGSSGLVLSVEEIAKRNGEVILDIEDLKI